MEINQTIWFYILPFVFSFILIHPITWLVRKVALRYQIMDIANVSRKIQRSPVPLLGGLAIFISLFIAMAVFYKFGFLTDSKIQPICLLGIVLASLLLVIGGVLDDKYSLSPTKQFIWPIMACLLVLLFGLKVSFITNPFGGILYMDNWQLNIFGVMLYPLAQGLAFFWLLGMIYTTKFLDGLDGLVSGIATIGAIVIFIVSLSWDIPFSGTSVFALIIGGLFAGFLIWNIFPAKIFLGEAGATLAGFLLGVAAIISGSKITTTLLVMGLPILDVVWVIFRRVFLERKSPTHGDRKHLHFRLLDSGLSHTQAVLVLYFFAAVFGSLSLFNTSQGKLILLIVLVLSMIILGFYLVKNYHLVTSSSYHSTSDILDIDEDISKREAKKSRNEKLNKSDE